MRCNGYEADIQLRPISTAPTSRTRHNFQLKNSTSHITPIKGTNYNLDDLYSLMFCGSSFIFALFVVNIFNRLNSYSRIVKMFFTKFSQAKVNAA